MQLDILVDGSPDGPIVRLSEFTVGEAELLLDCATTLANKTVRSIQLDVLPYVQVHDCCRLSLSEFDWDAAIVRIGHDAFDCRFTAETWDNVAGLIEPFTRGSDGFQWLARVPGEARLLLSKDGSW